MAVHAQLGRVLTPPATTERRAKVAQPDKSVVQSLLLTFNSEGSVRTADAAHRINGRPRPTLFLFRFGMAPLGILRPRVVDLL
jgi:hypothetical protein